MQLAVQILVASFGLSFAVISYWIHKHRQGYAAVIYADQKTPLIQEIISKCSSLRTRFKPLFSNGHLLTGYGTLRKNIHLNYERELVDFADGGSVGLDWLVSDSKDSRRPVIIVLHGLTGGSQENYVRHFVNCAVKTGFDTVVFNFRGANDTVLKTPRSYSAAQTDDLQHVAKYVQAKRPEAMIFAIGYSLGANVLVKYLGEEGDKTPLRAAVSISNPFSLVNSSKHIEESFMGKFLYTKVLGGNLTRFLKRHAHVVKQLTSIDMDYVLSNKVTLREFDEYITRRALGYPSVDAYYEDASSARYIHNVKIPLLCLSALDDPIVPASSIPYKECEKNPNVVLVTTSTGGHLGWVEGSLFKEKSWMDKVATEFLETARQLLLVQ